jgi:hypothetical protein
MMSRRFALLCVTAACSVLGGCGKEEYTGERRFQLSGKVTVDGDPMGMGVISFLPQEKGGRVSGGPINDGIYTVPEPKGPNAGTHRVEIYWNKLTGKKIRDPFDKNGQIDEMMQGLPEKYNTKSELTADISSKSTTFDFPLTTK